MKWIKTEDRMPPDNWRGLVIADVRMDRPVFAHTTDAHYRLEFPFANYFIGPWRDSLSISEHMKKIAKIVLWLEADNLYPPIPIEE